MTELFSLGDSTSFEQRLAEAIAWCGDRALAADPKNSLRTPSLLPSLLERTRADAVRHLLTYRCAQLFNVGVQPITNDRELNGGRLLCYYPDANLADGAAEFVSGGFFDGDNVPPWDTWVGLYGADHDDSGYGVYLISYVPEIFVQAASVGIDVNPEACIVWLYDSDTEINARLRKEAWRF